MLKFWALLALMTFAVKSAYSIKKWTYYKAEYTNKERRCSRGTNELGPYAYRGTTFGGPAWSVALFFDDPQLYTESPWYAGMIGDTQLLEADSIRLVDILHEYSERSRKSRSLGYDRKEQIFTNHDASLEYKEDDQYNFDPEDEYINSFRGSNSHFVATGLRKPPPKYGRRFHALRIISAK